MVEELKSFDESIIGKAVKIFPIIVGIIAFFIGVGYSKRMVDDVADSVKKINDHEVRIVKIEAALADIQEIKADMKVVLRHVAAESSMRNR